MISAITLNAQGVQNNYRVCEKWSKNNVQSCNQNNLKLKTEQNPSFSGKNSREKGNFAAGMFIFFVITGAAAFLGLVFGLIGQMGIHPAPVMQPEHIPPIPKPSHVSPQNLMRLLRPI